MGLFASKPSSPTFQLSTPPPKPPSSIVPILGTLVGLAVLFFVIYKLAEAARSTGLAGAADQIASEVDGKTGSTVASSISGSNTNLQFWMYIKDWDYKFGQRKAVIAQTSSTNSRIRVPAVSLHPTDNSLDIAVSVYPTTPSLETTNTGTGDVQTVTVENVPLQSWFAVSITIYGRNLDVYINGQLVKSAVLAGIPMPATGNLIVGGGGGFSGSVCGVNSTSVQLQPADAARFYAVGTACSTSTASSSSSLNNLSLFGYTFVFGVKDGSGKDVTGLSSSDVSSWFSSSK